MVYLLRVQALESIKLVQILALTSTHHVALDKVTQPPFLPL